MHRQEYTYIQTLGGLSMNQVHDSTQDKWYRVDCGLYYRPDTVYIRYTTWNGSTIANFEGCKFYNDIPECYECRECRKAAQNRFDREHPELQHICWKLP